MLDRQRVAVVPHTHWDREWYAPFQEFRLRLVDTLDEFLPLLERDGSYRHFLLDGQMAVVDDYLAVRPEAAERIRRLVAAGRLSVGPWYVLMDEFLVSGETIVRDLQLGLARAAAFGGAMEVGYLPDMFGHVAQMPQLLQQAGFAHAVVWRGVPAAIDRSAFWWRAPDGSTVRAEYLVEGYWNGSAIADDPAQLVARLRRFRKRFGHQLTGPILFMNGVDHETPQPWLGKVVAEAGAQQDEFDIEVTSLAAHLASAPVADLPTWEGELRSGSRANLLMGVTSNRVDVRRAAARAERALERLAEPLCALHLHAERWPAALLDEGWLHVVRNAAHDSVCACSVDEVVDAVLHRYAEARHIGEGLAHRAVDSLARSMADAGWVVVNPAARDRDVVVELDVPGVDVPAGCQAVDADEATYGPGEAPYELVRHEPHRRVAALVPSVPGFGWRLIGDVVPPRHPVSVDRTSMRNGLVEVAVDEADGTFALDGHRGFGRVVDGGDRGDTYNYDPPADDNVIDEPVSVAVRLLEPGPVRGRLEVVRRYRWPERVEGSTRTGARDVAVRTRLELRAGERFVRTTVTFDNPCRDHRVRVRYPLPEPATTSHAECAYAVVERGLDAEGGPSERGLPTYPARRFVRAGRVTVAHEGVAEYELVDGGCALAVTVLRATGMLSGWDLAYRPEPAGPAIPVEGPQLLGPVVAEHAVGLDVDDPFALADALVLSTPVRATAGGGDRAPSGTALVVRGAEVACVRRVAAGLEVRVWNPSASPTTLELPGRRGWVVDLRDRPLERFDSAMPLGPWRIATLHLTDA